MDEANARQNTGGVEAAHILKYTGGWPEGGEGAGEIRLLIEAAFTGTRIRGRLEL